MGMLDIFRGKQEIQRAMILADRERQHERMLREWEEDASIVMLNGLQDALGKIIQKSYSLNDYQTWGQDDKGGFFDPEFDLKSTAARLKGLYGREPWCFITADKIARAMIRVPMKIRDVVSGETLDDHPAYDVVNGGNVNQSGLNMNWSGYIDLIMGGNFFKVLDEQFSNPHHVPIEFINLKLRNIDTQMRLQEAKDLGLVQGLEISRSSQTSGYQGKAFVPYENVVHFKLANPYTPLFGMSPYTSASRPILLDRNKSEFELAFYHRGATNAGAIETTEEITKKRMERLMRTFEQAFTGKRNWWRTIFLPKGAKWVNSGLTMAEMQHMEGLKENRRTLLAVMGVPPSQAGIVEDVNRATAEVQERAFWVVTIVPLCDFIADGYNNSYLFKQVYGGMVEVYPDYSGIEALQGSLVTRGENAKSLDDVATINEQREIAGLEPLPDNDPRGNMFISELRAGTSAALLVGGPMPGGGGPDPSVPGDTESDDLPVNVEAGDNDHTHIGEIDPNDLTGETTSTTGGSTPDHVHQLEGTRQSDGTITVKILEGGSTPHTHPDVTLTEDQAGDAQKRITFIRVKANAVANQSRVAESQYRRFLTVLGEYRSMLVTQTQFALRKGNDVGMYLRNSQAIRQNFYVSRGLPLLGDTMVRGFDLGVKTTKDFGDQSHSVASRMRMPALYRGLKPIDEQALEVLKQRNEKGQRLSLAQRNLTNFYGFDATQTDNIVGLVEDGLRNGMRTEDIAKSIEQTYGQYYGDQAFTIARTEVLSAISAGQQWQQDELKQIFDKVNKQWFHVGDVGSNPNARKAHAGFEALGEVPYDYVYENHSTGGRLSLPRDPRGGAADVINCRCSSVSVIPSDATSNAGDFVGG